jgi:2-polyprenyl-3-methyl-5-hydroxy-6-metoxy-1,4-benzoquinol methylase
MEPRDTYRGFAEHYDLHSMDWYAKSHYGRRLVELLRERGLAGSRILDAGCGTGTMALALAREGHQVTGVDLSEPLLGVARRKDSGGAVRWLQGDLTRLDLGETFDAAVCVGDVLNHLEALDDWEGAFRGFAAHLRPGGALVFDVMTCLGLERLDKFAVQEIAGATLVLGIIWEPALRRSTLKILSFRPVPDTGLYERACETIPEWGQPVSGIFERLARAGFTEVERLWGGAGDPEQDERLAVFARRA